MEIPADLVSDARAWLDDSRKLIRAQTAIAHEHLKAIMLVAAAVPMLLERAIATLMSGFDRDQEAEEILAVLPTSPLVPVASITPTEKLPVIAPAKTREQLKLEKYPDRSAELEAAGAAPAPPPWEPDPVKE